MTRRIDVRILTPFGQESGMGNWRTASRYAHMLRASGINAAVFEPSAADDALVSSGQRTVAVVLNARLYYCHSVSRMCFQGDYKVRVPMTPGSKAPISYVWEITPKQASDPSL